MTLTPWGEASELRARRLARGPRTPPEQVAANQRERLFGAMVASVAERGYGASRVEDLVAISGVSRSSFYALFADKHECFMATLAAILAGTQALIAQSFGGEGPWEERAREGLGTLFGLIAEQPAAARLCFADVYAAGPEAVAAVEASLAGFERLTREALEQLPGQAGMPAALVRAMMGAQRNLIHTRIYQGREAELPGMVEGLWELGRGYRTPPAPLNGRRPAPIAPAVEKHYSAATAILAAAGEVFAERGYTATTIAQIAAGASISRSTLYAHFNGKEEVLIAALDAGQSQLLAAALPAYRRSRDWPWGVRSAIEATLAHLASHPTFARLVAVEAYAAGPAALGYRERATTTLGELLAPGHERAPAVPEIAAEAITAGIHALISERVRAGEAARLREQAPLATYIALTPFLGAEAACEVARAKGPPRRGD